MSRRDPTDDSTSRPSLKRELLLNFALIAGAAISLAVLTALVAQLLEPRYAVIGLMLMIIADVLVVFAFGRHLLEKLVLRPVDDLIRVTDRLGQGDLTARAEPTPTEELSRLAERFNRMTERLEEARAELVRAEKLASIGRLATGIAHEVGNPLSAIGTYLEVLRRKGADPDLVVAIEREAGRIDRIVRGLLAYARPQDEEVRAIDVGSVVRNAVALLRHQGTFDTIELAVEIANDLPPARATAHGLEQALVNLLANAADAAPRGTIAVGATPRAFHAAGAWERRSTDLTRDRLPERRVWKRPVRPEIADGTPGVLLWVADSGAGIPAADRDRVFDPFFTTKEPGFGTGLGLAIVQGTVHEMGGLVWVEDAREGGAAFKIFLPRAGSDDARRSPLDGE